MKLGPVHIIRDKTFQRLHGLENLWHHFSSELANASSQSNPLADQVLEQTHGLQHSPLCARTAPAVLPTAEPTPTEADLAAAERVVRAYQKTLQDSPEPPTPSMWDRIAGEKPAFLEALRQGNVSQVAAGLCQMFTTDLTWGLGHVHSSHPELLRSESPTHLHLRFTDTLINLAEAIGVARVTAMLQNSIDHLQPLNRDLEETYRHAAREIGFDITFPNVGNSFGFELNGGLVTIDSLIHAYTPFRLRQLGYGPEARVYEIGGGYGCLAYLARKAGYEDYSIYDLPWVNVLQGYFLIRSLPEHTIQLYGEADGTLRVLPYWQLAAEADGSCDVLINTDSLPEMGRDTAAGYIAQIHRLIQGVFLSINQEAKGEVPGVGPQNCVRELVNEHGHFRTVSRHRYWLRQGYVEELFAKKAV